MDHQDCVGLAPRIGKIIDDVMHVKTGGDLLDGHESASFFAD
jgi:hypothetical protein